MAPLEPVPDITALLDAWSHGDAEARDQLMPLVYEELRRRARALLRRENPGHTLQPTALVHEAYLRLAGERRMVWQNRTQFYAVAGQMMRRILVDHARAHKAAKRSGEWSRMSLADAEVTSPSIPVDVLDLHSALEELNEFDARKSQIAELRYFAGLSLAETGHVLNISVATVEREWQAARAWLLSRMTRSRRDA